MKQLFKILCPKGFPKKASDRIVFGWFILSVCVLCMAVDGAPFIFYLADAANIAITWLRVRKIDFSSLEE